MLKPSSTWALATFVATNLANPAAAQIPASIQATQDSKERCAQAIALFDRYGASRTENSDGQRNHTRIGVEIDCQKGRYKEGIMAIEDLLRRKKFDVPASPYLPAERRG
ncbi:MAG: hypothetical protein K2Y51_00550 [Gammaproteobacteria bacterium]|nr:hypothetical protein [Gammaproteobacteria bacterium]